MWSFWSLGGIDCFVSGGARNDNDASREDRPTTHRQTEPRGDAGKWRSRPTDRLSRREKHCPAAQERKCPKIPSGRPPARPWAALVSSCALVLSLITEPSETVGEHYHYHLLLLHQPIRRTRCLDSFKRNDDISFKFIDLELCAQQMTEFGHSTASFSED